MRASRHAYAAFCFLSIQGLARVANADDRHTRAAESFREGQAAFERHEFSSAAAAFEVAAAFEPKAVSFLDAAEAWTRAGEPVRASEDCDRALAMPAISDAERAYASRLLQKNEASVSTVRITAKSTVTFKLDGGDDLHAPLQKRLAPGVHAIDWKDLVSGEHVHQDLALGSGQIQNLVAPFPDVAPSRKAEPPPGSSATSHRSWRVPVGSWISGGAALAAVGVAGVFGVLTLDAQNDFNANPTSTTRDAFYRDRTIANVGWGVAAVGLVTAVVIAVIGNAGDTHARDAWSIEPLRIHF